MAPKIDIFKHNLHVDKILIEVIGQSVLRFSIADQSEMQLHRIVVMQIWVIKQQSSSNGATFFQPTVE